MMGAQKAALPHKYLFAVCVMRDLFSLRVGGADVAVNTPDRTTLLRDVRDRLRRGAGFAIATLNLDHIVKLRRMAAFRRAYLRQDLVTADGNPIVWLSRLAGRPVSLVTGSDLVDPLCAVAAEEGATVALLGATPATLARAGDALIARHPGLSIVARLAPGQGFDPNGAEATAMIEELRRSGARLTFLALGAPKQEIFAARCRDALPGVGFVSVGAGLDFIAESQRRAPVWMRKLAIEWLWRLLTNPSRLAARYAECAAELPALAYRVVTRERA
jgi:exopolysaccharide biosynthesis WecB/TagA/CpsF family protein